MVQQECDDLFKLNYGNKVYNTQNYRQLILPMLLCHRSQCNHLLFQHNQNTVAFKFNKFIFFEHLDLKKLRHLRSTTT